MSYLIPNSNTEFTISVWIFLSSPPGIYTSQFLVKVSIFSSVCFIFSSICCCLAAKSCQSCPTLCDPTEGSPPGSPVPGILQARTLEWVAISFSNAWKWKVKVKSLSHVRLLATPWTAPHQAPPSMRVSRQECWSGSPVPSLFHLLEHTNNIYFKSPHLLTPINIWILLSHFPLSSHSCGFSHTVLSLSILSFLLNAGHYVVKKKN